MASQLSDWYWIVGGDETRFFSSKALAEGGYAAAYVRGLPAPWFPNVGAVAEAAPAEFESALVPTRIANEFELDLVLRQSVSSDGIGRSFTAQEALDAMRLIDEAEVKRLLGREDVREAVDGDAEKLADFAYRLQPARRVDALSYPDIDGKRSKLDRLGTLEGRATPQSR